jgi:uncharacterized membrane protein
VSRSRGSLRGALAWGLLWAAIGAAALYVLAPNPWPMQPSRVPELQASLSVLDHGGPALLGYRPGTHIPYAIGYSEDQGIFLIVPVLSHWLGQSSAVVVMRWVWLAAWTSSILFSAAVARSIFRSWWAALAVPPALVVLILSFGFGEIYWVSAWCIVTLMPVLILLARNRPRRMWVALVSIALVAGVVTAIRADAGLPVALGAVAVATMTSRRNAIRLVVILAVAFAYLAPTWIALPAVRAHRDSRVGVDLSAHDPTSHELWHTLYIGLGYTSNRFGIHYLDRYGNVAAHEIDPTLPIPSPAYEETLHRQVDALIEHDPGFVTRAEAEKAVVELFLAAPYLLALALLLPAALTARSPARLRRSELALFIPALVIGVFPAIIAAPFRDYSLSLLGPLAALCLLAIGSLAARAQADWDPIEAAGAGLLLRARLLVRRLLRELPRRATIRSLLVALVILIPVAVLARDLEAAHARWDSRERDQPTVVLAAAPISATHSSA